MAITRANAKGTVNTSRAVLSNQPSMKTAPPTKEGVKKISFKKRAVRRSKSQFASKNRVSEESDEETEDPKTNTDEDADEVHQFEKKPIFKVFKSDEKLDEGLCVVRNLGNGIYELVNLDHTPQDDMAAEKMGEMIKAVPGRREMLSISVKQWEEVRLKVDLAGNSADGQIFRLMKLPIELRYKIYEEVLISPKGLHKAKNVIYPGLGLLLSCRPIYEECLQFVYRNPFGLTGNEIASLSKSNSVFSTRIRDLRFWWTGSIKSGATFRWIAKFPELKTLRLHCFSHAALLPDSENKNKLYQDEDTIKGYRKGHGFDSLVQIRGLERVIIEKTWATTEKEKKAFERFLMRVLRLPKEPKVTRSRRTRSAASAAGSAAGKS